MLCRIFGLIPTRTFLFMTIFKNEPISEKYKKYPVLSNIYGTIANDLVC